MGYYVNPHDEAEKQGRALEKKETFDELMAQLEDGEVLVVHLDRVMFKQTPCLYSQMEFDEFKRQIDDGIVLLLGYYAFPADKHPEAKEALKRMKGE